MAGALMLVADLVIKPERVMQGIGEVLQSLDELRAVHSRAVLVIAHGMCGPAPLLKGSTRASLTYCVLKDASARTTSSLRVDWVDSWNVVHLGGIDLGSPLRKSALHAAHVLDPG